MNMVIHRRLKPQDELPAARPAAGAQPSSRVLAGLARRRPSARPAPPRTWNALAWRRWPGALWIQGTPPSEGPAWALLSRCGGGLTVTLWADRGAAETTRVDLDRLGCGGRCHPTGHNVLFLGARLEPGQ
jgi:hypothetical protein